MVGYQGISSWLPSKKTVSYSQIISPGWTLEGEFSFQTLGNTSLGPDLDEIRERRTTLHARRYFGSSFHLSFGAAFSTFKARTGSSFVDGSGGPVRSSLSAENLGLSGGVGHRWQWAQGLTVGVDWLRLCVPVLKTHVNQGDLGALESAGNREDVKDVLRTFNRVPTFVLLGVNVGYSF